MHNFDRLTKAVVAAGSWDPLNSQLRDANVRPKSGRPLRALGVRAEICATLVDDEGPRWPAT